MAFILMPPHTPCLPAGREADSSDVWFSLGLAVFMFAFMLVRSYSAALSEAKKKSNSDKLGKQRHD